MTTPSSDFSYGGDPSEGGVDELRFLVQDTDSGFPLLTDTEYQYLLDKWMPLYESVTYVAALAAAVISRKFAGVVDVSADGVSVSTSGLSDRYKGLAEELRDEYRQEGATGGLPLLDNIMSGTQWDPSIEALEFGMHSMDNPAAGRQNYGGTKYGHYPVYDPLKGEWV